MSYHDLIEELQEDEISKSFRLLHGVSMGLAFAAKTLLLAPKP